MTKVLQADVSPLDSPLSDAEISWIASTMCLSAVFGVSMYAYIADTYGRRVGIVAIAIPQAVSSLVLCYPSTQMLNATFSVSGTHRKTVF